MAPATGSNLPAPFSYLLGKHWCTLDTETTGLGPNHQVIQIAVKDGLTGELLLDSLVRPTCAIDLGAERVHGISDEMVALAPTWPEVRYKLMAAVRGKTICVYNAKFDIQMMMQSNGAWNIRCDGYFGAKEYFCVMTEYARRARIYNHFRAGNRNFKLVRAAELEGIQVSDIDLHSAAGDVELTSRLISKVLGEFSLSANEPEFQEFGTEFDMPEAEPWREL